MENFSSIMHKNNFKSYSSTNEIPDKEGIIIIAKSIKKENGIEFKIESVHIKNINERNVINITPPINITSSEYGKDVIYLYSNLTEPKLSKIRKEIENTRNK